MLTARCPRCTLPSNLDLPCCITHDPFTAPHMLHLTHWDTSYTSARAPSNSFLLLVLCLQFRLKCMTSPLLSMLVFFKLPICFHHHPIQGRPAGHILTCS